MSAWTDLPLETLIELERILDAKCPRERCTSRDPAKMAEESERLHMAHAIGRRSVHGDVLAAINRLRGRGPQNDGDLVRDIAAGAVNGDGA